MLDQLRGENGFFALLESVPGIGCVLAERLHGEFGIDSLEVGANQDGLAKSWESKKLTGVTDILVSRLERVQGWASFIKQGPPSSAVRDGSGITMHQPHRFLKFRIA
jgi:hypothetical protein